jgi:two-component system, cell cycle sensor histidine kinase and response regulator CckA
MSGRADDPEWLRQEIETLRRRVEALELEAAQAQQENAAKLQITIEDAPVGVATVGPDKRFLSCNHAFCSFLGYAEAELTRMTIAEVTFPEDVEIGMPELRAIAQGEKKSSTVQKRYARKDGAVVWAEVNLNLVRDRQGQPRYFLAVVRDITEHKRTVQRLQETSRRLELALRSAQAGSWDWDIDSGHLEWSPHMFALFGLDPRTSVASFEAWRRALHPEDRELAEQRIDQALKRRTQLDSDYRVRLPEGQLRWINAVGEGVYDAQGQPIRMTGICLDITERKQAEEMLLFRNILLSTQQEASLDGILVVDEEARIQSWNRRFVELWGLPARLVEAGVDEPVLAFVTAQTADPRAFLARVQHLYEHRQETGRDEIALADGRVFDRYSAPMFGPGGRYFGRVWYFRDITDRKRAEEERERLEEQLRVAQKMEAVGRLAGGIAHDFNNLLSVILSFTEFALEGVREGDPLRDDLLEVKNAGERAAALTRQLLAFGRKQVLQLVPLDLNEIARGVEKMLRRILGEDIDLVQALAPDLGVVRADPGQLEQVIMNLVINARDAMPQGGKLTIETSNAELDVEYTARHMGVKPGPYVLLAVSDTGCGLDPESQARLFEPFFTTKEKGKGTGLGLSTVYGIVKQSGGDVWAYSEPGKGTTFKIYLPRELLDIAATTLKPSPEPTRATGTETILVVEDEEALRKVARRSLEAAGYTVLSAGDGEEALRIVAGHVGPLHLLLTDVVMPHMGGRLLAEELVRTRPDLRVLYMSGYTDDAVVRHGVLDSGTNFLAKPFTSTDLARKVREVLDGGSGSGATCR